MMSQIIIDDTEDSDSKEEEDAEKSESTDAKEKIDESFSDLSNEIKE